MTFNAYSVRQVIVRYHHVRPQSVIWKVPQVVFPTQLRFAFRHDARPYSVKVEAVKLIAGCPERIRIAAVGQSNANATLPVLVFELSLRFSHLGTTEVFHDAM
jgi:hypothetical protein